MARAAAYRWAWIGFALAAGCAGSTPAQRSDRAAGSGTPLAAAHGQRYLWVSAECNDGPLDLARLGFERELHVTSTTTGALLTFDTQLATRGCFATSVIAVSAGPEAGLHRLEPQAIVALPEGECGPAEQKPTLGRVRVDGERLEIESRDSPFCRGFDARFVYRRTEPVRLDERQLVTRYIAHWNRGDAQALAQLFVDSGSLIEPFTRTDDGNYKRHEGRAAVQAWYANAFATTPWHALRLRELTPGTEPGQVTADWDYMDPRLSAPLSGRNLFVIAGGEIYESEIQLVSDPQPAAPASAATAPPVVTAQDR